MTHFINTTPHAIHDLESDTVFPPNKEFEIRVTYSRKLVSTALFNDKGIAMYRKTFGELSFTPPVQDRVFYIVSLLVKQARPDRTDFISPSDQVRDANGVIIGCKGFDV